MECTESLDSVDCILLLASGSFSRNYRGRIAKSMIGGWKKEWMRVKGSFGLKILKVLIET